MVSVCACEFAKGGEANKAYGCENQYLPSSIFWV